MTSPTPTPASDPAGPAPIRARRALDAFHQLTTQIHQRLATGIVLPQVEASWRQQQDAYLEIARTEALVSIAESLAAIATQPEGR